MGAGRVALYHQSCFHRQAGIPVAIHQRKAGGLSFRQLQKQRGIGPVHRQKGRLQNIDLIDLPLVGKSDTVKYAGVLRQYGKDSLPALFGHLFGIIKSRQLQPCGQHHTGVTYRAGQRAPPHLVYPTQALKVPLCFVIFPQVSVIGHPGTLSSVIRPSVPLRNSSSSMMAARSVFTSPPATSIPRLRPMASSSS